MIDITILTPTYNRADTLKRLYESLLVQSQHNFQWLIVDDGSTDSTRDLISDLMNKKAIDINYVYQENGGKARALNTGFRSVETKVFAVVDSDDYLKSNAIETINKYLNYVESDKEIGGFFFHYEQKDIGKIYSKKELEKDMIFNCFEYFKEYGKHDGCLCYLNEVVKAYEYPEYSGEKYVGPTVLQMEMAEKYKVLYSPVVIGTAEYQPNGLTNSGRNLRVRNPLGMLYYNSLKQKQANNKLEKFKASTFMWAYAILSKKKVTAIDILKTNNHHFYMTLSLIPGIFLSCYWTMKYNLKNGSELKK
ncbi:glycosyltransferase family A protein [Exiguobacterium aurantiacum]|uniref:glycosyltransferase family A protein n=1 Tax=Exiguobacterium aurantiacum TaxID=33987 RepID=UPI00384C08E4